MKTLLTTFLLICSMASVAQADSTTVNGKWAGIAFASGAIDLDGDGNGARPVDVRAYDQLYFTRVQGIVDSSLVAFPGDPANTCPNPATEFELRPLGKLVLRGWTDGALFLLIDETVHLCFNPFAPEETLVAHIIGGTGIYAGKTGTAVFVLRDTVLEATPEGFPLVVDTQGDFTVTFQ